MKWEEIKLGDAIDLIDGDRGKNYPKKDEFSKDGYCLFLDTGNVTADGFCFDVCSYISKEKDDILRGGKLKRNDVVLTTRGTLGNVAYYSENIKHEAIQINSGKLILRPHKCLNSGFLYYFIKSPEFQNTINLIRSGSAQPQLPVKTLKTMKIRFPELAVQEHICGVLSAYDELMENNRRQIKRLEEAAQRLYKEWFVRLKFPGHETTPISDGMPEGWKRGTLGNLVYESGKRINARDRDEYAHYLPIDVVPAKSFSCWASKPITEAESSLLAFKKGDFIFGAMRPYFHKAIVAPYAGLTRSTCFVLQAKNAQAKYFAYMALFWSKQLDLQLQLVLAPQCLMSDGVIFKKWV